MRMRTRRVIASSAIALALSACASVTEGTVYDKRFEPEHVVTHRESVYRDDCGYDYELNWDTGEYELQWDCDQVFSHYRYWDETIPDCWRLFFKNAEGDKGDSCVPQYTWAEMQDGSYYRPAKET